MEVETYEHAGLTIRIWTEEYIEDWMSPREDVDGLLGVMFCDHRDYRLGDKDAPDPRNQKIECKVCEGSGEGKLYEVVDNRAYGRVRETGAFESLQTAEAYIERNEPDDASWVAELQDCPVCEGSGEVEVGLVEYLVREHGARVILPLFLYDHSGITMSTGGRLDTGADNFDRRGRFTGDGAGWDTSSVGVIFDTTESRERCGWEERTDEEIEADLDSEVAVYATYLEGGVYGYSVLDNNGDLDGKGKVIESCGGMIDSEIWSEEKSWVIKEAKEAAEACAERIEAERAERAEWAARDTVTV